MGSIGTIGFLSDGCVPDCLPVICEETILCLDIEFPRVFGVEFQGTISDPGTPGTVADAVNCGVTYEDLNYEYEPALLQFFGETIEVAHSFACCWCTEGTPFTVSQPANPSPVDNAIWLAGDSTGPCALAVTTDCGGGVGHPVQFPSVSLGMEDLAYSIECTVSDESLPEEGCSTTYHREVVVNTMPYCLDVSVCITDLAGGGLTVTVKVQVDYGHFISTIGWSISSGPGGEEYDCDTTGSASWGCTDNPGDDLFGAHAKFEMSYKREFPLATSWDDIVDEEIPLLIGIGTNYQWGGTTAYPWTDMCTYTEGEDCALIPSIISPRGVRVGIVSEECFCVLHNL